MGKASKKKKQRAHEDTTIRKNENKVSFWTSKTDKITLIEDALFGLLFLSVALLFSTSIHVHFTLPKLLALRICSFFLVLLWIVRFKKGEIRPVPPFIFYTGVAFGLWLIFSTFFALHKPTALHGVYGRYNALLNHELYIILFFLVASMPMDLKRISRIAGLFSFALTPVAIYAIIQYYNIDFFPWPTGRSASTIGNPVILGAVLSLGFPFVLTFLLRHKTNTARIIWGTLLLLFLFAMFTTISRGPMLSVIISAAFILFINRKECRKEIKRLAFFIIPVIVLLSVFIISSPASLEKMGQRFKDISNWKTDRNIQVRLVYYKAALEGIKEYPVMGVGLESFRIIYPRYRQAQEGQARDVIPTMVHNGYLQLALTNGIPALVLYILFICAVFFTLFRTLYSSTDSGKSFFISAFIGMAAGYLAQDLSGWMEIALTPFFWILLGAGVAISIDKQNKDRVIGWKAKGMYAFLTLVSIGLIYLSFDALSRIYANRLFWQAQHMSVVKDWKQVEQNINEGLAVMSGDFYHEDMAGILYLKRVNEVSDQDAYFKGSKLLEQAHRHNPYDVYVMIHRIDLEVIALKKGMIQKPSDFVEKLVPLMLKMDKNNPTVYESAIKLKLEERKHKDVLKLLEKARALHPDEIKYYILEGNMHSADGDDSKAVESFKKGISIAENNGLFNEEWANAKYSLTAFYMNKRLFDKALKEIEDVKLRLPGNARTYVMAGDIYGVTGNFDKARESFNAALKIDPNNQNARKGLEQIKKITGR